ncbi:DNA repair protein RecN [Rhodococcus sp. BP-252]|uniref:DNA repair protein RecN n=1 Tax=unclassified Rhodococcus (in: high G+C Gram-positive bacteria) TaxID=192944 RepID=UPI001C9AAB7D|nr:MULTISPECIES: DNA repair protein RecN [unclassified Rhodococcus (in: high G+C Gram-positive bacteria)]MBY6410276.1 DNA repair protein RecN [Rhodococcus sp. BP-320]MBY6415245.1 DNA repair protein RecN [Rhodococcus sp. BP-321]MBY6424253.1 DNA repair protein RecN [Rhodococcus sp. BP-324]MBY6429393.1 DNA repair protein RecN [Rhodococcus sp. BP-323]MBY6430141.1 DNA repair protein RecN [Rhodococcus sp. BP-322]
MLEEIRIDSLGVISSASAQFHEGLTVLTGETGAGKTMVVTSLHLLSGARADAGRVRLGADRAVVEGRFSTETASAQVVDEVEQVLESAGAQRDEDDSIIALRTVNADGRSRAHLGGRSVPASVLSGFTDSLLTVHGQNDQLRLLRPDRQLGALDRFAGDAVSGPLKKYRSARSAWLAARTELLDRTERSRELAQEADRLQFGLQEIDAVAPEPGEDVTVANDVRRLGDLDSLRESAEYASAALSGDDAGEGLSVLHLLGEARSRLESADDAVLTELVPRLNEALAVVTDVGADITSYLADLPSDPSALETLLNRQAELKGLTRKYAADVDGVIAWADDARERLGKIDVSADALAELSARVDETAAEVAATASKLSAARAKAAAKLAKAVSTELAGLAMGKAKLQLDLRTMPAGPNDSAPLTVDGTELHAGQSGVDEVEFKLSAHDGAQALPISKSASGGELSRVMLALEVVLAGSDKGATMVFDEVDAGVGGRAAVEVGRRLARLARTHQVIVVTHLPQVAAFADTHLVVNKADAKKGAANSGVKSLSSSERVVELARMLAGLDDTETGRAHAEELLATARADREN